jgi:hypothetical protein
MHSISRIVYQLAWPLAIGMLIVWGIGTFAFNGPGWIHILLTVGMFLLFWRIVTTDRTSADRHEH